VIHLKVVSVKVPFEVVQMTPTNWVVLASAVRARARASVRVSLADWFPALRANACQQ
jgi:hypothetical protein